MTTRHTNSAGGVVLSSSNAILIVSQHGDSWSLPKGHIDDGESPLEAAKREIAEEAGVTLLTYIQDLGSYKRFRISKAGGDDPTELKSIQMYLFTTPQIELRPTDPDNPEARWVSAHEVQDLLTHPKDVAFFQKVLPTINTHIASRASIA